MSGSGQSVAARVLLDLLDVLRERLSLHRQRRNPGGRLLLRTVRNSLLAADRLPPLHFTEEAAVRRPALGRVALCFPRGGARVVCAVVIRNHLPNAPLRVASGTQEIVPSIGQIAAMQLELRFRQLYLSLEGPDCRGAMFAAGQLRQACAVLGNEPSGLVKALP